MANSRLFLAGVIEGFYGQPWSHAERLELIGALARRGLNAYLYAPKDDRHHRLLWRECYAEPEARELGELIKACRDRELHFIYALSPGLDIRYSEASEVDHLKHRLRQMLQLGCEHFAILFDDIPERGDVDLTRWGSLAAAQAHVAKSLFAWVRQLRPSGRFAFCPTAYCGRMSERGVGGADYLDILGRELPADIDIFWTGPEIVSCEITTTQVEAITARIGRKPLIWDNLHANDYDGRRFHCGPYSGRPPELRASVSGILSNPNCEFPLNEIPIRTLAEFVHASEPWDPRHQYVEAMREWQGHFSTCGEEITVKDLIFLGDCYYLPHGEGATAQAFFEEAMGLVNGDPALRDAAADDVRRQAIQLRDICSRMASLRDRRLFYALSRRIWELREEMDLVQQYIAFHSMPQNTGSAFTPDSHLPGTYRGGFVAKFQRMLIQNDDGTIVATAPSPAAVERRGVDANTTGDGS
jgi:protein O-GlcNAcase/histone acetyltransferase